MPKGRYLFTMTDPLTRIQEFPMPTIWTDLYLKGHDDRISAYSVLPLFQLPEFLPTWFSQQQQPAELLRFVHDKGLVNSDFSELSISYVTQSNPGSRHRNFCGKWVRAWKPASPQGADSGLSLEDV